MSKTNISQVNKDLVQQVDNSIYAIASMNSREKRLADIMRELELLKHDLRDDYKNQYELTKSLGWLK